MIDLSKSYEYFHPESVEGRIHIIGCGSIGATLAENLLRLGLTKLTLWDFDKVEAHNLANQIFRQKDIGKPKVEALRDILTEIDPDCAGELRLQPKGWDGQQLGGYVFLCVDNIDLRRRIVEQHMDSPYIRAMLDFRTGLECAQLYAADWSDRQMKQNLLNSMSFTHEEAKAETPVSACGVTLGVVSTVRAAVAFGVANLVNYVNGKGLRKFINIDIFHYVLDSFL